MLDAVAPMQLRAECRERCREIRTAEAVALPRREIFRDACEIFRLMRKVAGERGDFIRCSVGEFRRATVIDEAHARVRFLDRAEGVDDSLQPHPRRSQHEGRAIFQMKCRGIIGPAVRGHRQPMHDVQPELEMVVLAEVLVAKQQRIGDDDDATAAKFRARDHARAGRMCVRRSTPRRARAGTRRRARSGAVKTRAGREVRER